MKKSVNSYIFNLLVAACAGWAVISQAYGQKPEPTAAALPFNACWTSPGLGFQAFSAAAGEGSIFVADTSGRVRSLDLKTGRSNWSSEIGGLISSDISVSGSELFITSNVASNQDVTSQRSTLRAISTETGITRWSAEIPFSPRLYLLDTVSAVIAVGSTGDIHAVSKSGGEIVWVAKVDGEIGTRPAIDSKRLLVSTSTKQIILLTPQDGRIVGRFSISRPVTAQALGEDGMIVLGDDRGNLSLKKPNGDTSWRFRNGARIAEIINTEKGILASSFDNFVYLLHERNGNVIWKKRFSGRVWGAPLVFAEQILVTTNADGRAELISLDTGKLIREFVLNDGEYVGLPPIAGNAAAAVFVSPEGTRLFGLPDCPEMKKDGPNGRPD